MLRARCAGAAMGKAPFCRAVRRYRPDGEAVVAFDTHKFWKTLVTKGFSGAQAEVICNTLTEAVIQNQQQNGSAMVDKISHHKTEEWARHQVDACRRQMDDMKINFDNALAKQRDELKRIEANHKLDLSLEKSRITSETHRMTTLIQSFEDKCNLHTSKVAADLMGVRDRAETKIANQRWIVGSVFIGGLSISLTFVRFFIM